MIEKLVFASANKNKVEEIKAKLGGIPVLGLGDIGCLEEIPETGHTIEANALQKANYVFEKYHCDCFADDTGLEVEALDNAPGVDTAYYAGPQKDSAANRKKMLDNLAGAGNRKARFITVIALKHKGQTHLFTGICNGRIATEEAGSDGWGYDPIFIPEGYDQTFAQLGMEIKNKVSHRGKAIAQLKNFLENQ